MRFLLCFVVALCIGCSSSGEEPDFTIHAPTQAVTLPLGQQVDIPVTVDRYGDLSTTIVVTASDLRAGITAGTARFPDGQNEALLQLNIETSVVTGPIDGATLIGIAGDLERTAPIDLLVVD